MGDAATETVKEAGSLLSRIFSSEGVQLKLSLPVTGDFMKNKTEGLLKWAVTIIILFSLFAAYTGFVAWVRSDFSGFASVEEAVSTGMGNLNETARALFGVSDYENFENVEHEE